MLHDQVLLLGLLRMPGSLHTHNACMLGCSTTMRPQIVTRSDSQGTYYLVAASNPALNTVTLAAPFYKVNVKAGDTLAGASADFQPLGQV